MADVAHTSIGDPTPRASGSGIVMSGDRSREFGRARWHSALVRMLRIGAPLGSLSICVLYVSTMLYTAGYGRAPTPPSIPDTVPDLTMHNPVYEGFTKDGGSYTITSITAVPDLTNPSLVQLNDITGVQFDARKSRTDMTAKHGLFDNKASRLDLSDGIEVVTQTGMHARLQTATMMTKEGTMVTHDPVTVDMPTGTVASKQMNLNQKTHDVTFFDQVKTHLVPQAKPEAPASTEGSGAAVGTSTPPTQTPPIQKGAPAVTASAGPVPPVAGAAQTPVVAQNQGGAQNQAPPRAFGNASAPVDIDSDQLDIHDASKVAKFTGHVHAVQTGAVLDTTYLNVDYEGGGAGAAPGTSAAPGQPSTKIKHISAPGPVVLTQPTGEKVTGDKADFDPTTETAVITGTVVMTGSQERHATADRVEFQQQRDTFFLTGNVVVVQARNELRGRHLTVDRKLGKTELISPAEGSLGKSRIFARFYQNGANPAAGAAGKPAVKAVETTAAASPLAGATNFKTDPNAPIDIEAERLNGDDLKKTAIFTGNVNAAQGDFQIRTIELVATYSGDGGLASVGPHDATPGQPAKTPAQLTRIDAKGKVVVTSKDGKKVVGDTGVYDLKADSVVVTGKDVFLSMNEKEPIRCGKVHIEMTSGLTNCLFDGSNGGVIGVPGASVQAGQIGKDGTVIERPRLVIYPSTHDKQKPGATAAPVAAASPAKPSSSSWEQSVTPAPQ